jgi:hypothetical protein
MTKSYAATLLVLLVGVVHRVMADFHVFLIDSGFFACGFNVPTCECIQSGTGRATVSNITPAGSDPPGSTFFQVNGLCGTAVFDVYMNGGNGTVYIHDGPGTLEANCTTKIVDGQSCTSGRSTVNWIEKLQCSDTSPGKVCL